MQEINDLRLKLRDMSKLAFSMWQTTFKAFIEHDLDLFPGILDNEHKLNELEKTVIVDLAELGRSGLKKGQKAKAEIYAEIAGDLELIGDYCKDILERVQIKIEEKLMFSEDSFKEYKQLYHKSEEALEEVVCALDKDKPALAREVMHNAKDFQALLDEFRKRHNQRLVDGVCSPLSCNMFLNMLDFTGQIFHHTKSVAENLLKLK